jgi:precorrin-8X/cobalt-precorrin-8 methylmutase
MSVHLRPEEIEAASFAIIDAEVGDHPWSAAEWPVVRRVIHTSADFDYSRTMVFSRTAIASGVAALRKGRGILTDTTMALAGIAKQRLAHFGIRGSCFVADPDVARLAKEEGVTRSLIAMRKGVSDPHNGIFVIGNAPTALFELIRLIRSKGVMPDLVIGFPVGFVGAVESKEALLLMEEEFPELPFITSRGRKGGSNVAAAVVNALLILAMEGEKQ